MLHVAVWSAFDSHSVLDVQSTALGALIQLAMSTDLRTGLEVPWKKWLGDAAFEPGRGDSN